MLSERLECQRKKAELAAGQGALLLGLGIGVVAASWLQRFVTFILIAGIVIHRLGMFDKHQLDQSARTDDLCWSNLLYWIWWRLLAVFLFWGYVHH